MTSAAGSFINATMIKKQLSITASPFIRKQTEPVLDYYKKKGLLADIDGEREIDEVTSDIRKAL